MSLIRHIALIAMILTGSLWAGPISAQEQTPQQNHVRMILAPEFTAVEPGMTVYIALKQEIDQGWHTYWKNPGDSGAPPRIEWHMPEGFTTGDILWPVPERINFGPLTNYGYKEQAILLMPLTLPQKLPQGPVKIEADIEILVCEETCIPEFHQLAFTFNDGSAEENNELITAAFDHMPVEINWPATYRTDGEGNFIVDLTFEQPQLVTKGKEKVLFDLFPYDWGVVDNSAATSVEMTKRDEKHNHHLILYKKRGDRPLGKLGELQLLIPFMKQNGIYTALKVNAEPDEKWLASGAADKVVKKARAKGAPAPFGLPQISLLQALLFAVLGGIILNLMPCVFPILSMKALALCKMNEKSHAAARGHGLAYTAGIMLCFALIAGLLIALKSAGSQIGWGFQLQNPVVVLLLAYLLFVIGLNLSGLFEIKGSFTNVGAGLGQREGVTESFFTGILATLVATPCTAPFMGAAMGFALVQPAAISLAVFLALGFGLALPYLALSFFPALRAALPKPGHWMIIFREFLAFPMYASAAWLIWVYSQQAGTMGLLYALAGLVGISFAIWIFRTAPEKGAGKLALRGLAVIILLGVLMMGISGSSTQPAETRIVSPDENAYWQPYTPERYAALLEQDAPVFVNMTAAWCISCKVNERVALNTQSTRALFADHDVRYLKGDWTSQDPAITAYLARYGRNGVPLYVFYGRRDPVTGKRPEPVMLPQILTPAMIAEVIGPNAVVTKGD